MPGKDKMTQVELILENMKLRKQISALAEALSFYADPESYHAIAFIGDPPCGEFSDDFSDVDHYHYDRPMPGKLARETLDAIEKEEGGQCKK